MKTFEIWFYDLSEDAQKRYMACVGAKDESDLNVDIAPIAIVDMETENESNQ